jgi:hypothetical protein
MVSAVHHVQNLNSLRRAPLLLIGARRAAELSRGGKTHTVGLFAHRPNRSWFRRAACRSSTSLIREWKTVVNGITEKSRLQWESEPASICGIDLSRATDGLGCECPLVAGRRRRQAKRPNAGHRNMITASRPEVDVGLRSPRPATTTQNQ